MDAVIEIFNQVFNQVGVKKEYSVFYDAVPAEHRPYIVMAKKTLQSQGIWMQEVIFADGKNTYNVWRGK